MGIGAGSDGLSESQGMLAADSDIEKKHPWNNIETGCETKRVAKCTESGRLFEGHLQGFR